MKNFFKNFFNTGYKYHKDVVIVACYYNPSKNPLRTKAFKEWYQTIKHLEHRVVECSINGSDWEIPLNDNIIRVNAFSNLWHKETLLNKVINSLSTEQYKYVFWMDTDVIMENKNWLVESVEKFEQGFDVIQPFSKCKHLTPEHNYREIPFKNFKSYSDDYILSIARVSNIWRGFACVFREDPKRFWSNTYDLHGHVGFIWGAKLKNLKICSLFEKGLIGGSDHIMAHATTGQFNEKDIKEVYEENLDEVLLFMEKWNKIHNSLTYVEGNLYHIYHGDLKKRDYYKRIKDFTPFTKEIRSKDVNGFYVATDEAESYYNNYYESRESVEEIQSVFMFPDDLSNVETPVGFGDGDFGGSGAGDSYETQNFS